MSNAAVEFTFSCPHCGQHISAATADAEIQAQCPVCSQAFIVPLPPPPRRPFTGGARHQTANAASPTLAKRLYRVLAIVLLAAATIGAGFLLLKKKHAESGASQVTIPMERQLACTWEGLDGLHDTLTFAEDHGFRATYYAPSSRSGGKPLRLDCSGMWWSTGEDSFSFREGGEVSNGKIEGGALVLSRTGGTSLHFRKSLAQTNENSTEQEVPGDKARKLLFEAVENGDLSATFVLTLLQGNTIPSEEQVRNLCAQRRKRQAEEKAAIKSNSPEPIPAATTTAHKADPSVAGTPAVSAEKRVIKVTAKDLETSGKKFDNQTVVMDGTFIEINYYWVQHLNDIKFIGRGFIGFRIQDSTGEEFDFAFADKEKWERQLSQMKKGEKRQFIGKVKNVNLLGDTCCLFIEDVQR